MDLESLGMVLGFSHLTLELFLCSLLEIGLYFSKEDRHNKFQHILSSFDKVGSDSGSGVIPIHQDVNMYVSEMDPGKSLDFVVEKRRQLYMVCIEGSVSVDKDESSTVLEARDALTVRNFASTKTL